MRRIHWVVLAVLLLLLVGSARRAQASVPTADPGFAFVDVNGDGLYSPTDGDIGLRSTPSVDINALIQSDGNFDTGVNKGAYHAPSRPVSLVIPASQRLALATALKLKAGVNLIVHGTLIAPSMTLQAGRNVDLTASQETFDTLMLVYANGDAILNGTSAAGNFTNSQLFVSACGSVAANPTNGLSTGLFAAMGIGIAAGCNVSLDNAALLSFAPKSSIFVGAGSDVKATDFTFLTADITSSSSTGTVLVQSRCGSVVFTTSRLFGGSIGIGAACDANVTDTSIQSEAATSLQAGGQITGNSLLTNVIAAAFCASGNRGVDLSSSAILATAGGINLSSCRGSIAVNSAALRATGGVMAHAQSNISTVGTNVTTDHVVCFLSDCGTFSGASSIIQPFTSSLTDTAVSVTARGLVDATSVNWSVPSKITLQSTASNVTAPGAALQTTQPSGLIQMNAAGGTIDVTAATLLSAGVQFGPPGVHVIGP